MDKQGTRLGWKFVASLRLLGLGGRCQKRRHKRYRMCSRTPRSSITSAIVALTPKLLRRRATYSKREENGGVPVVAIRRISVLDPSSQVAQQVKVVVQIITHTGSDRCCRLAAHRI
jgi:hypothetical protein